MFAQTIGVESGSFERARMTMQVSPRQVIDTSWSGERYSQRIWHNQAAIAERLKNSMEDMLVQGRGLPDIKRQIMDEFRVAFNDADRIVRTEAAYVFNRANMEKYKRAGIRKVRWSTGKLDGRECEVCASRQNKVYALDSAPMIPAHPRCRCIYAPVVEAGLTGDAEDVTIHAEGVLGPTQPAAPDPVENVLGVRKTTQFDIADALSGTNPNFGSDAGYKRNCQRCVQTYEFRRRGYDAEALPKPATGNRVVWGTECFEGISATVPYAIYDDSSRVKSTIAQAPDNSRFLVYVKWKGPKGGAHVFIAEKTSNVVRYVDPQIGDDDVSRYFGRGERFGVYRLDDKAITNDTSIITETMKGR